MAADHGLLWPRCCLVCACSGVADAGSGHFMCLSCGAYMVPVVSGFRVLTEREFALLGLALAADVTKAGLAFVH